MGDFEYGLEYVQPQSIAYPSPDVRPRTQETEPLAAHVIVLFAQDFSWWAD
jgi:hypothetical protein